jgi:hypothetical protein
MVRILLATCALVLAAAAPALAQNCLHGANETSASKTRRDQALQIAIRINQQQAMMPRLNARRRYVPLEQLANIPAVPPGFDLQLHTDGQTYAFSLKDRLDPCGYAIFSDQEREIYEGVPRRGVVTVPLDTN